jgi:hypothetical protein
VRSNQPGLFIFGHNESVYLGVRGDALTTFQSYSMRVRHRCLDNRHIWMEQTNVLQDASWMEPLSLYHFKSVSPELLPIISRQEIVRIAEAIYDLDSRRFQSGHPFRIQRGVG